MRVRKSVIGIVFVAAVIGALVVVSGTPLNILQDSDHPAGDFTVAKVPSSEVLQEMNNTPRETVTVLRWSAVNQTQNGSYIDSLLERASINNTAEIEATSDQAQTISNTLDPYLPAKDGTSVVLFIQYKNETYRLTGGLEI